jgi:hypothetical protein
MQLLFYRWIGFGLVGCFCCGCSEKVESVEKLEIVDPFGGNEVVVDEQVAEKAEIDPVEAFVANKLRRIIIPRIDFNDVSFESAIDYLRLRLVDLDHTESDHAMRGMSLVIRRPKSVLKSEVGEGLLGEELGAHTISDLRARNISAATAMRYICIMTNMRCKVDEGVITFFPNDPNAAWDDVGSFLEEEGDTTAVSMKLNQIRIPRVQFENISFEDAVDFLRIKFTEMHLAEVDSAHKGINFVAYVPKGREIPSLDRLELQDVPVEEVLKQICEKAGMRYVLDPYSVIIVPKDLK